MVGLGLVGPNWKKYMGTTRCECGCGRFVRFAAQTDSARGVMRGWPLRFVCGHNQRGKKLSPDLVARRAEKLRGIPRPESVRQKISAANKGKKRSRLWRYRLGGAWRGKKQPDSMRAARVRGRYGRDPVESPYVSGLFVVFRPKSSRWYCSAVGRPGSATHARVVYEHFYGSVPAGYHVHHKDGRAADLHDDRPENLMLVPAIWNFCYLPVLSRGFGVLEERVTEVYSGLVGVAPEAWLFAEVCAELCVLAKESRKEIERVYSDRS